MSLYVRKTSIIKFVVMNSIITRVLHKIASNSKMFKTMSNKYFCRHNLNMKYRKIRDLEKINLLKAK